MLSTVANTDPDTPAKTKSYLNIATQELERVAHITRKTLAFHRENNTSKTVDLRQSIDSALRIFAPRLEWKGIVVEKRYAEVEPIQSFGGEMEQVISNLLTNSLDAIQDGGEIKVRLSRSRNGNGFRTVHLSIADTGSGIPQHQLRNIFEPFYTTKEAVGTGLGLWVSKQIVEKHGATIRVRSKVGVGTVFSIAFPVANET